MFTIMNIPPQTLHKQIPFLAHEKTLEKIEGSLSASNLKLITSQLQKLTSPVEITIDRIKYSIPLKGVVFFYLYMIHPPELSGQQDKYYIIKAFQNQGGYSITDQERILVFNHARVEMLLQSLEIAITDQNAEAQKEIMEKIKTPLKVISSIKIEELIDTTPKESLEKIHTARKKIYNACQKNSTSNLPVLFDITSHSFSSSRSSSSSSISHSSTSSTTTSQITHLQPKDSRPRRPKECLYFINNILNTQATLYLDTAQPIKESPCPHLVRQKTKRVKIDLTCKKDGYAQLLKTLNDMRTSNELLCIGAVFIQSKNAVAITIAKENEELEISIFDYEDASTHTFTTLDDTRDFLTDRHSKKSPHDPILFFETYIAQCDLPASLSPTIPHPVLTSADTQRLPVIDAAQLLQAVITLSDISGFLAEAATVLEKTQTEVSITINDEEHDTTVERLVFYHLHMIHLNECQDNFSWNFPPFYIQAAFQNENGYHSSATDRHRAIQRAQLQILLAGIKEEMTEHGVSFPVDFMKQHMKKFEEIQQSLDTRDRILTRIQEISPQNVLEIINQVEKEMDTKWKLS